MTVGNGFVQGFFGANTLLCTNLAGGSLSGYTPLTITTNVVIFDGLLTVGDPTTNTTVNATSIITANIYTAALTVGNAITNAVIGAAGLSYGTATLNAKGVFIGANVSANMTTIAVGTAGSNTFINSTALSTSNVITANLYANLVGGNTMYVGNAATNAQLNATSFSLATVTVVNTTGLFVGANVSVNTTTIAIGVGSTNTVINSTATVSGNAVQNSTGFYYGANVVTNATSMVVGSATVNTVQNSSGFYVGQNVALGVANLIIGSGVTNVSINSTAFSGVANNATNFAWSGASLLCKRNKSDHKCHHHR